MSRPRCTVLLVLALLLAARAADAALTTPKCLVQKRQAWAALRKCEAGEELKRLKGKTPDFAKCQTKFDVKIATIEVKVVAAQIACRFGNNGDGTVTDYDTGLQWERKRGVFGGLCQLDDQHCTNLTFTYDEAVQFVDADSIGTIVTCFLGHCDWRLPTLRELRSIRIEPCTAAPCIDPAFGSTAPGRYWSASAFSSGGFGLRWVDFATGSIGGASPNFEYYVRAVRPGL